MNTQQVALLRGINVGRAKRIAMAELRELVEALGFGEVRTLLNSGNVIYDAPGLSPAQAGARIEAGIKESLGVSSRVIVLSAAELRQVIKENPLLDVADDPSRLLVAVLRDPSDRSRLEALLAQDWTPERLAAGSRAGYLWCPNGISGGLLAEALDRSLRDTVTTRNWSTIQKLAALVGA